MGDVVDKLVSPNGFDGRGPVPEPVSVAAKRIATLRTQFVNQWTPGMVNPLTTSQIQQWFDASAVLAEWTREVYEARDTLAAEVAALREERERLTAVVEAAQDIDFDDFREWEMCERCDGIGQDANARFWCSACRANGGSYGSLVPELERLEAALAALAPEPEGRGA